MREFRDEEGRPWRIALTSASATRVRDMVTILATEEHQQPDGTKKTVTVEKPFDIVDIGTVSQTLQVMRQQFLKLSEVLYAILIAQVHERNLTKEQFFEGLRGDSLEAAGKALTQELIDFFPQRLRSVVVLIADKTEAMTNEVIDQAVVSLTELKAADLPGMPSTRPPESSESTPESGPSVSL